DHADGEERRSMSEAPDRADQRRAPQAPALAHDGRDGRQVIDVQGVTQAEHESDGEQAGRCRRHEGLPQVQGRRMPICASAWTEIKSPAPETTSALATGTSRATRRPAGRRLNQRRAYTKRSPIAVSTTARPTLKATIRSRPKAMRPREIAPSITTS